MKKGSVPTITGIVLTYNSARLLDRCLSSLDFCDTLLVVDSHSKDSSVDIAKAHGAHILVRTWEGIGKQFEFALEHVQTDWVFIIDSDEVCSKKLKEEILAVLENNTNCETALDQDIVGYYIPRKSWYFDRFMEHSGWRPDRLFRLFKKNAARIHMSGAHQTFIPLGAAGQLNADIIHYPYSSFANQLDKLNDYAQRGADDLRAKGVHGGVLAGLGHGFARFCKLYFFKQGFRDGRAGFINAAHGAIYAFLKYVRVLHADWGAPFDHE